MLGIFIERGYIIICRVFSDELMFPLEGYPRKTGHCAHQEKEYDACGRFVVPARLLIIYRINIIFWSHFVDLVHYGHSISLIYMCKSSPPHNLYTVQHLLE